MPRTEVIEKELSRNDVGATDAHQAGIYVGTPNTVPDFFPDLDETQENPETWITFLDDSGRPYRFHLIYWNQRTRNEYHLTNMTEFFERENAGASDHLLLSRDDDGNFHASIVAAGGDLPGEVVRREGAWTVRSVPPGDTPARDRPAAPGEAPDADSDPDEDYRRGLPEGAKTRVEVNRYERSRANRDRCLSVHGYDCRVCGMNFEEQYGEIGKDYIEVHHLTPLPDLDEDYEIDPTTDLVPVCPNCHRMIHRRNPPYTVDEMKAILQEA